MVKNGMKKYIGNDKPKASPATVTEWFFYDNHQISDNEHGHGHGHSHGHDHGHSHGHSHGAKITKEDP